MDRDYWLKQIKDEPLFPDLLWSRPETKSSAGKLLIVGGNAHGFAAPAEAFRLAEKAGAGHIRMLLPDSLKKYVGPAFTDGDLAPTTPSGSFSTKALSQLLDEAAWADGVLLAGDFGRNSETAILLENFLDKYSGQVTITKDAADYCYASAEEVFKRQMTTLVISMAQLQRFCNELDKAHAVTFSMDLIRLVDCLHSLTTEYPIAIVVKHLGNICAAFNGQVSTTRLQQDVSVWRVRVAAGAAVWQLQNPAQVFEATTTALTLID